MAASKPPQTFTNAAWKLSRPAVMKKKVLKSNALQGIRPKQPCRTRTANEGTCSNRRRVENSPPTPAPLFASFTVTGGALRKKKITGDRSMHKPPITTKASSQPKKLFAKSGLLASVVPLITYSDVIVA